MGKRLKKVFIFAYKEMNLGDDLFILHLVKRYPETRFIMIANKEYHAKWKSITNLKVYDKYSIVHKCLQKFRLYEKWEEAIIHSCDYAVYIGGSVFMEYERWTEQYQWYEKLFDNSKLFFIGCNWGPCKTDTFHRNMKNVLSNMRDVCFRDMASFNAFCELKNVRYAPDILFGTVFPETVPKKQIFISVIDCPSKEEGGKTLHQYEASYLSNLKILIEFFAEKEYEIKLVSFCEKEKDSIAINKLKSKLTRESLSCISEISYDGDNWNDVLREIKASSLIVGSRFHAVILGLAANVPVFPMIYSDKTLNVLSDLRFKGEYLDIRVPQEIKMEDIYMSLEQWEKPEDLSSWIEKSNQHFLVLDETLSE